MPLSKIEKKPCDCPSELYNYVKKEYKTTEGPYQLIHRFEVKECQNHKFTWGRRRKEVKIKKCITPVEGYRLDENDLEFFRSVFTALWNGKINEKAWNNKIRKKYQNKNPDDISNSFIQKGLILLKTNVIQKSNKEKNYILFTDTGKKKIKNLIGFLSVEEQISIGKDKLLGVLNNEKSENIIENRRIIFNLLNDQLEKLESNNPLWETLEENTIIPRNSANNPPKYLLVLFGLCTWFQIYRENLTLREVSARAFQRSPFMINEDPSKILDKYSSDINSIIMKFSGKFCDELGLVLALDLFTFSGYLILNMYSGNSIKIGGSSVSFSNLSYSDIKTIDINADKVLLIENFAVFAQLVLDNWAIENKAMLIFIKGMGVSGHFRKGILKKIIENNPKASYFVWLDYDLGGCNIYREILKNLEIENIQILKIPSFLIVPYREIPSNQIELIKNFIKSENLELRDFAQFIFKKGKVEQEYLLEWYKSILDYNLKRNLANEYSN